MQRRHGGIHQPVGQLLLGPAMRSRFQLPAAQPVECLGRDDLAHKLYPRHRGFHVPFIVQVVGVNQRRVRRVAGTQGDAAAASDLCRADTHRDAMVVNAWPARQCQRPVQVGGGLQGGHEMRLDIRRVQTG